LSTMTRPDVAWCASKLSQFLTRPGPQHMAAVDRVIQYLWTTRYLCLKFGGLGDEEGNSPEYFMAATDASFGDNPDRKSSQGMLFMLLGGSILWKATKQSTITTSTTDAELTALSAGAKELRALQRLFKQVDLQLPGNSVQRIHCDNLQTVRIVREEAPRVITKMLHVDIHQLWVRQEHREKRLDVVWVPTSQMIADGFTKPLPLQRHRQFVQALNMEEMSTEQMDEDLEGTGAP
jgi:hypothetical protein